MLGQAHILALANEMDKHILIIQDKEKNAYNCCVDILHYKPGWDQPKKVIRRDACTLLEAGAVPLHLDYPPSHFSALIPLAWSTIRQSPRVPNRGTELPNGTILVGSP